jgi:haloacid dehalogenase-like hydrolase
MKNRFLLITGTALLCIFFSFCKMEKSASEIQAAKEDAINKVEALRIKYGVAAEDSKIDESKLEELIISGEKIDLEKVEKVFAGLYEGRIKSEEKRRYYLEVVKPEVDKAKTRKEIVKLAQKYPQYISIPEEWLKE